MLSHSHPRQLVGEVYEEHFTLVDIDLRLGIAVVELTGVVEVHVDIHSRQAGRQALSRLSTTFCLAEKGLLVKLL